MWIKYIYFRRSVVDSDENDHNRRYLYIYCWASLYFNTWFFGDYQALITCESGVNLTDKKKGRRNYHFFLLHIYSLRDVIARNSKTLLRFITRTKQVWRRADMVYFLSDPDLTFYVTKLKIIRFITYHDGRDSFWTLKSYIYGNN